jgi:exodeoxyribonuclease-5
LKGCDGATTIHSLIYRPRSSKEETDTPSFKINFDSPLTKADLLIIDECSMVDEDLGRDLLSFGVPVLVLGDPAQLPPVRGGGYFTEREPDSMLQEVHRQAADNPIVALSMRIRAGEPLEKMESDRCRVISRRDLSSEDILQADQVLVGRNKTRRLYNQRIRELIGRTEVFPSAGDKLVCLRNDKSKGLLNGSCWVVDQTMKQEKSLIKMRIKPDDPVSKGIALVKVLPEYFEGTDDDLPYALKARSDAFDYGYTLTVHKSQGSQWDHVVLFDESFAFREDRHRWLYTGVTRAAETLTVVV